MPDNTSQSTIKSIFIDPTKPLVFEAEKQENNRRIHAKQIKYPNLNAGYSAFGNQNAVKFNTPGKRQAFCKAYCNHISSGMSKMSFSFKGAGVQTFKKYREKYPSDFKTEMIEKAEADNFYIWEEIGIKGTLGELKGFRADTWKFNMMNRFHWKNKADTTSGNKETPKVFVSQDKTPD